MPLKERVVKSQDLTAISGAGTTITTKDASVFTKQSTVANHSLWIPIQRYKAMRKASHRPDYVAPLENIDTGTTFYTVRASMANSHDNVTLGNRKYGVDYSYRGPVRAYGSPGVVLDTNSNYPAPIGLGFERSRYLDGLGTTAISRCAPTNPVMDAAVTLGELRKEGLPKLTGLRLWRDSRSGKLDHKTLADEYLNVQFGIMPLVRDIQSLARIASDGARILSEYEQHSGKRLRRRYHFPEKETVETVDLGMSQAVGYFPSTHLFPGGISSIQGPFTNTTRVVERAWFSGEFTYHMFTKGTSPSMDIQREFQRAKKLFGLRLDVEVAFNLTGWTWLIDYFSNLGDVVHNLAAFGQDGLVMRYGYLMCTTVTEVEYRLATPFFGDVVTTFSQTEKVRRKATPYGFAIDLDGLTPHQISILAALGLSRV